MKWRSAWPIFHGPVTVLKTIWCMDILWDYESVWPSAWHQNKCRSLWPIFHGPLILPYILKTVWCMNIILWDYESVWPDVWPQNKCRSLWPLFHGPVILPCTLKIFWCMNIIFGIMSLYDTTCDLKINLGHCDLYFMVRWFCLVIGCILKTIWCMTIILWNYESVWHDIWPKNRCRSLWPIFHGPVILRYLLKTISGIILAWKFGERKNSH